jgi:hypothetical protein
MVSEYPASATFCVSTTDQERSRRQLPRQCLDNDRPKRRWRGRERATAVVQADGERWVRDSRQTIEHTQRRGQPDGRSQCDTKARFDGRPEPVQFGLVNAMRQARRPFPARLARAGEKSKKAGLPSRTGGARNQLPYLAVSAITPRETAPHGVE